MFFGIVSDPEHSPESCSEPDGVPKLRGQLQPAQGPFKGAGHQHHGPGVGRVRGPAAAVGVLPGRRAGPCAVRRPPAEHVHGWAVDVLRGEPGRVGAGAVRVRGVLRGPDARGPAQGERADHPALRPLGLRSVPVHTVRAAVRLHQPGDVSAGRRAAELFDDVNFQ